jgi:hypothetical protein
MRAAVVGGGAYMAGKSMARRQAGQAQAEDDQNARISDLEQQPASQPASVPAQQSSPAESSGMVDQLKQLAQLHQQGILTDDEFAAAKAKLF